MPEETFAASMLPHLDAAYALARWLVRDPALAQDIAQDAMLRALRHFHTWRGESARSWLLRIVRNTAYTALAARGARLELPEDAAAEMPDPAPDPESTLTGKQDAGQLEEALASLPPELRECIVLRELEELSYKEIGRITGVPIGTVMSRLWRARQALLRAHQAECVA